MGGVVITDKSLSFGVAGESGVLGMGVTQDVKGRPTGPRMQELAGDENFISLDTANTNRVTIISLEPDSLFWNGAEYIKVVKWTIVAQVEQAWTSSPLTGNWQMPSDLVGPIAASEPMKKSMGETLAGNFTELLTAAVLGGAVGGLPGALAGAVGYSVPALIELGQQLGSVFSPIANFPPMATDSPVAIYELYPPEKQKIRGGGAFGTGGGIAEIDDDGYIKNLCNPLNADKVSVMKADLLSKLSNQLDFSGYLMEGLPLTPTYTSLESDLDSAWDKMVVYYCDQSIKIENKIDMNYEKLQEVMDRYFMLKDMSVFVQKVGVPMTEFNITETLGNVSSFVQSDLLMDLGEF